MWCVRRVGVRVLEPRGEQQRLPFPDKVLRSCRDLRVWNGKASISIPPRRTTVPGILHHTQVAWAGRSLHVVKEHGWWTVGASVMITPGVSAILILALFLRVGMHGSLQRMCISARLAYSKYILRKVRQRGGGGTLDAGGGSKAMCVAFPCCSVHWGTCAGPRHPNFAAAARR